MANEVKEQVNVQAVNGQGTKAEPVAALVKAAQAYAERVAELRVQHNQVSDRKKSLGAFEFASEVIEKGIRAMESVIDGRQAKLFRDLVQQGMDVKEAQKIAGVKETLTHGYDRP